MTSKARIASDVDFMMGSSRKAMTKFCGMPTGIRSTRNLLRLNLDVNQNAERLMITPKALATKTANRLDDYAEGVGQFEPRVGANATTLGAKSPEFIQR